MPKKRKLIWTLYPWLLMLFVSAIAAIIWLSNKSLDDINRILTERYLKHQAYLIGLAVLEDQETTNPEDKAEQLCLALAKKIDVTVVILSPLGNVWGHTAGVPSEFPNQVLSPEIQNANAGKPSTMIGHDYETQRDYIEYTYPVLEDKQLILIVQLKQYLVYEPTFLRDRMIRIFAATVVIFLFLQFVVITFTRKIKQPIQKIITFNKSIRTTDSWKWIPDSEIVEMSELVGSIRHVWEDLEEQIKLANMQYSEAELILGSMVEAVMVFDDQEKLIRFNQAAQKLFHFKDNNPIDRNVVELIRNTHLHRFVRQTLSMQRVREAQIVFYGEDNEEIFTHAYGCQLQNDDKQVFGALIVLHDITRLYRLENIRRDFVANVSHELKTPVTTIKGFLETLLDGAMTDPKSAEHFLSIALERTNQLNAVIEDLLKLSRLEEGTRSGTITIDETNLREVVEKAVTLCRPQADDKQIRIVADCSADIRASVNRSLMTQALMNLIDNAIKYSNKETEVRILCSQEEKKVVIDVIDEGIGIGSEHIDRIFERFYRVDKSRSREMGGTGLGLAIVKHVVQAHGGTISVKSIPGKGSRFTIQLFLLS
ncbi:PAS domain-containing protein [bacterium]|nr:PAS domain-containing protein [candidate division CSSED10-310 bacterium]